MVCRTLHHASCNMNVGARTDPTQRLHRDLPLTEALDYLSAVAIVFHGLLLVGSRVLGPHRRELGALLTAAVAAGFAAHCYYMLAVHFDYGWNMRLCIALGAVQSLLWVVRD